MKKPIIAIVSLTCCEGCQVAIMDLGERFFKLAGHLIIGDFSFVQEQATHKSFDITFIEGAPITKENIDSLKGIRQKTRYLIAIGACACLGGIAEIKNYLNRNETIKYVYRNIEFINNPEIKPVSTYVPVDLEIPGCPINKEEFFALTKKIIAYLSSGKQEKLNIKIPEQPVCYECQLRHNICLLQHGESCLGPIILGGCNAPCPTASYPCDGCRGPLKEPIAMDNLKKILAEKFLEDEINKILERFGVRDQIEEKSKIKNQK
jgi:coenzyme F420-reducing hydrogenase gamma subunit